MTRIYSLLAILLFSLLRLAAEQKAPGYHLALTVQKLEKGFDPPRKMQVLVVGKSMVGDALRDGKASETCSFRTSLIVQRLSF